MSLSIRDLAAFIVSDILAVSDIYRRKIPNCIVLPALAAALLWDLTHTGELCPTAVCLMAAFVIILLIAFALGKIGGGDIKLYIFILLALPDARGLGVIAASIILATISIAALCLTGRYSRIRSGLPMAVFVGAGATISLLYPYLFTEI